MDMTEDNRDKVGEIMMNIVKCGYRNTLVFSFVPKHSELKQFPNSELIGTNVNILYRQKFLHTTSEAHCRLYSLTSVEFEVSMLLS